MDGGTLIESIDAISPETAATDKCTTWDKCDHPNGIVFFFLKKLGSLFKKITYNTSYIRKDWAQAIIIEIPVGHSAGDLGRLIQPCSTDKVIANEICEEKKQKPSASFHRG